MVTGSHKLLDVVIPEVDDSGSNFVARPLVRNIRKLVQNRKFVKEGGLYGKENMSTCEEQ